jgi:hypothetical protein
MQISTSPILIISLPRSGSSLTAGIFAQHGVWTGHCKSGDNKNPKGYFENLKVKHFMIKKFGRIVHAGIPADNTKTSRHELEKLILEDGYPNNNQKWLVKFSALYLPPWIEHFPNAHIIIVRRNVESIKQSGKQSGMLVKEKPIPAHLSMMEWAENNFNTSTVHFENLINQDFSEIKQALKDVGIEPKEDIIKKFVNPKLAHF